MIVRCRPLLGTFVAVTVPADRAGAADRAFAAMAHIHARMSFHERGSDLARIAAAAPGEPVTVDPETVAVLGVALALYRQTDGLFDVTVGRQMVRNRFLPKHGIGHLNRFNGTSADIYILGDDLVRIDRRLLVDLGGIAKGYAVDRAVETLIADGVAHGLVNAGGDLRAFGDRDWPVHLRDADDVVRHQLPARNCAVASSANLRNRRKVGGVLRSPHIGYGRQPVLADARVTVVADRCVIADAMTKVAMADAAKASRILAGYQGYILGLPAMAETA